MKKRNNATGTEWLLAAAVGLIISAALIASIMALVRRARQSVEPAVNEMAREGAALKDAGIAQLDGDEVKGQDVINYYSKCLDDYSGTYTAPFAFVINNGTATQTYYTRDSLSMIKDPADASHYVKPSHLYICNVTKSTNDEIIQVKFTIK